MGVLGLILIVIGIKYLPVFLAVANPPAGLDERPAILFFTEDDPCECMVEIVAQADEQMAGWSAGHPNSPPIVRIDMEQRLDLEAKYKVFRAPCLVLVDAQDQVVWRQDYPLIEGGPFKLDELDAAILILRAD